MSELDYNKLFRWKLDRDGGEFRVNYVGETVVVYVYLKDNKEFSCYRTAFENEAENVPEKQKLTGFANIYKDKSNTGLLHVTHKNKKDADLFSSKSRIACIDLSKYNIEFEEGEGL